MKEILDLAQLLVKELGLPPVLVGAMLVVATAALLYWHWAKNRHLFDGQWLRVRKVRGHLKEGDIDDAAFIKILAEERDEQVFAHVFGFRLDATKRDLLYPIIRAEGSPINSWWKAKEVMGFIRVQDAKIVVKLSGFDKVMGLFHRLYELFLAATMALIAALLLLELAMKGKDATSMFLALLLLGVVLFFMIRADPGVATAQKLEQWLKEGTACAPATIPVNVEAPAATSLKLSSVE